MINDWEENRKKRGLFLLTSFLLPALIQCVVYAFLGFYPFGEKSILVWDMEWQYVSFLSWLTNTIKNSGADSIFYSFSVAFGNSTAGLLGYYLLSPYNLFLLFFDTSTLPIGIFLITILKLSSCGLTMYVFLSERFRVIGWPPLLFSTSYALMAYNISQQQNIMWIDGVILLPLIALGIYRMVNHRKAVLMIVSLTLSFVINFYIGYMLGIFAIIYLLLEAALKASCNEIKRFLQDIVIGMVYIGICAGLSAMVILPVYFEISGGRMQGLSLKETLRLLFVVDESIWELVNKLFLGTYNVHQLKNGLPNIYTGYLGVIFFLLYFMNSRNSLKNRILSALPCVFLIFSMASRGINRIWHGFADTHGCSYRYSFLLSFLILVIAYRQFLDFYKEKESAIAWGKIITVLILLGFLYYHSYRGYFDHNSDYLSGNKIILSLLFLILWAVLLFLYKNGTDMKKKFLLPMLFIILAGELGINMGMYLNAFEYAHLGEYREYIRGASSIIDWLVDKDGFYRIENDIRYEENCYNDAMLLGYASLTHYSSTMPYSVSEYAYNIGMGQGLGEPRTWCSIEHADAESMGNLGVRYYITKNKPADISGWKEIQNTPYYVFENLCYKPIIRFEEETNGKVYIEYLQKARIRAQISNNSEEKQTIIMMLPHHAGWNIFIDGNLVTADQYQDLMMKVEIEKGDHYMEMSFFPPYLKEGVAISLFSLLLCFILIYCKNRKIIK